MEKIGKYQIQSKIGEGGMGVVYKAFDPFFERMVAVKTMSAQLCAEPDFRSRFFREARSIGKLNHVNIITVYDLGEDDGRPYLAMEYLDGQDLKTAISTRKRMSLEQKLRIMIEICNGLSYAHQMGIIHRDIKPGNIFITDAGQVKILDFGLARAVSSNTMTTRGSVLGTPSYMSPEQWSNSKVDSRSDIFSAGAVFYELLAYKKAFDGDTYEQIFYEIFHSEPEPLEKNDSTIPPELSPIVLRTMAKEAAKRYQHMDEVKRDLEAFRIPLEERKRKLQAEVKEAIGKLVQLRKENKELLEEGPAGPEETERFSLSFLRAPAMHDGDESAVVWRPPQDYFDLLDACQQAEFEYGRLSALVEKRRKAFPLLGEVAELEKSGHIEKALEVLQRILQDDPDHVRAASIHKELSGRFEQQRLEEQGALQAEALFQKAAAQYSSDDLSGCQTLLDEVLKLRPAHQAATALREGVQQKIRERAEEELRVRKERERLVGKLLEEARLLDKEGEEVTAIARLNQVLELEPAHIAGRKLKREIERRRQTRKRAERERQEKIAATLREAQEAKASGNLERAGELARSALAEDGTHAVALELLERVEAELEQRKEEEERKCARIATLLDAARRASTAKRFAEAIHSLDEILRLEADRPDVLEMRLQALVDLDAEKARQARQAEGEREKKSGLNLLREKRFQESLAALRRAGDLLGEDPAVQSGISEAEAAIRAEELHAQIQSAIREARNLLASEDFESARARVLRALQLSPKNFQAEDLLSRIDQAQEEKLRRTKIDALLVQSQQALIRKDFEEAAIRAREVFLLDAQNGEAANLLNRITQAQEDKRTKDEISTLLVRCRQARSQQDFDEALSCAQEVLHLDRSNEGAQKLVKEIEKEIRKRDRERWITPAKTAGTRMGIIKSAPLILIAALVLIMTFAAVPQLRELWRSTPAKRYGPITQAQFNMGNYEEANKILDLWLSKDSHNDQAQKLRQQTSEILKDLEAFDSAIKESAYDKAHDALMQVQTFNQVDPKTADRWVKLEVTFSPEFQDEFLGGLQFWRAPKTWRVDGGKLMVQGPEFGVLLKKHYTDFMATFNISFGNSKGAVWILRAARDLSSYYMFQLTGPKGKPANSFAGFKFLSGQRETIFGPILVGANLGQKDDQFNLIIKATGNTIEHRIAIVSEPAEEPRLLGRLTDTTFSGGTIGFGVKDNEEFIVRAFKIVPSKKSP